MIYLSVYFGFWFVYLTVGCCWRVNSTYVFAFILVNLLLMVCGLMLFAAWYLVFIVFWVLVVGVLAICFGYCF